MSEEKGLATHGGADEPSMDEILASIRRILKEDAGEDEVVSDEVVSAEEPEDEILILSAEMEAKPAANLAPEALPAAFFAPEPEPAASEPAPFDNTPGNGTEMEQVMDEHGQALAGLVSETVTAEISSALGPLMRSVSQDRSTMVGRAGVTLEDIVREEIRPVLKAWLDAHLPPLVERVVRAEIERVIDRTKF
jgi:cell pole-organizing protein PopZ